MFPLACAPTWRLVRAELAHHVAGGRRGELIRSGVTVAIVGPPNAGKSSLLNVLTARDAAIVSPVPGTTRDTVTVAIDLEGYKVTLVDTAGLRESGDEIEVAGMQRARSAMSNADIIMLVIDESLAPKGASSLISAVRKNSGARPDHGGVGSAASHALQESTPASVAPEDSMQALARLLLDVLPGEAQSDSLDSAAEVSGSEQRQDAAFGSREQPAEVLLVFNKSDLRSSSDSKPEQQGENSLRDVAEPSACSVSCRTGEGIEELLHTLERLVERIASSGEACEGEILITRLRHRRLLEECVAALERYEGIWQELELAAEELRTAASALGEVTGAIDTEDVLDAIFNEFCIGK